jgi:AcrR family transcriptional regulator
VNKRRVEDPDLVRKRRPQIIGAAIEQFGRRGFHATTIRDVADHAGVSIGMIYQYVRDKEDLLYLSVIEVVEHYIREIAKALDGVEEPLQRFVAIVAALTRVIDQHRAAAVLGYRESKSLSRKHMAYVMRREREIGDMVLQCIGDCIRAGVFRKVDAEMLKYECIIFAHNWALNSWRFSRRMSVETYIAKGLGLMLNPVLAKPDVPLALKPPGRSGRTPRARPRTAAKTRPASRRESVAT